VASPVRPRGRPRSRQRRPLASRACVLCRAPASAVPRSGTSSTSPSRSRACPQRDRPLDRILSVQQRRVRRRRAGSDDARPTPSCSPSRSSARGSGSPSEPSWSALMDTGRRRDWSRRRRRRTVPRRVRPARLSLGTPRDRDSSPSADRRERRHGPGMSALIAGNFRLMADRACPTSSSANTSGESAAGPAGK
jgi:hypothetical protein